MFHLSPNNRDQPDDVLLEDLRAVAEKLAKTKLTRDDYIGQGRFAPATIANRFGGWGRALERAGLATSRHFFVSREECITDLQRVARILGASEVSVSSYREHGKYSEKPFLTHFGSWMSSLAAAGLDVSENYKPRITDEALFENLEVVWQSIGRQPTVNDMHPPRSNYSADVYKRRFGGWRKALEAFVATSALPESTPAIVSAPVALDHATREPSPVRVQRNRSVGWRLRYKVLSRDRFACRACGRSPATHASLTLEVDHVVPWSKGGTTEESNLQTLCAECNGGKGAI